MLPLKKILKCASLFNRSRCTLTGGAFTNLYSTTVSVLENSLKVATEETSAITATIGMFFDAGPRYEKPDTNGITYMFEHMAYKSFGHIPKESFESKVESLGLKFKASTARDHIAFYTTCLPEDAETVVEILSDVLFQCDLRFEEIEQEKCSICQQLLDNDHDCRKLTFDFLHQTAFQGTQLAQTITGPTKNIANFTKSDIKKYMCEQFQPLRMVMASSGGLSHDTFYNIVKNKFGTFPLNPCFPNVKQPKRYTGSQICFRNDDLPYAHFAIGFEAPGFNSLEYVPMLVASSIMGSYDQSQGGGHNQSSYVARAMACTGFCFSFENFYFAYKDVGLWGFYCVAEGIKLDDVLYNVQNQWMSLCVTVTEAEVTRGINLTKTKLARMYASTESSCKDMAMQVLYTDKRRSLADYERELSQVSASTIKSIASDCLYDKCPAVAAVGPTEGLPDYNVIRAGMYWLRL